MSKRLFRSSVNFSKMSDVVPKFKVTEDAFVKLKVANDRCAVDVNAFPEKLPEIDWEVYKRRLPQAAGFFSEFEQKYKALKVTYPKQPTEIMNKISKAEGDWKAFLVKLKANEMKKHEKWNNLLDRFKNIPPADQLTYQELVHHFPDYAYNPLHRPADSEYCSPVQPLEEYAECSDYKIPDFKGEGH